MISVLDIKENTHLPSCEDDSGEFLQRGFSHLISVAREWEEQLAERWMRLPTGTTDALKRARLPHCGDMGQRKGVDCWNNRKVLELGKSKWQQKIGCQKNIYQSCNAKPNPGNFAERWVLNNGGEGREINRLLKFTVAQSFWVTWRDVFV